MPTVVRVTLAALVLLCSVVLSQPSPPPLSSRPDTTSGDVGAAANSHHADVEVAYRDDDHPVSELFDQCSPAAALLPRLDRVSLKTILRELGVISCYAFATISHALKIPTEPINASVPTVQYCNWVETWATTGSSFTVSNAADIYAQCDCIAPYVPPIDRLGLGRVVQALKIHDPAAVETIAAALQMPPCGSVTVAQLCRWLRDNGPQCPPYPHPATEEPSTPTTTPTKPTTPIPGAQGSSEYPMPGESQSEGPTLPPNPHPEPLTPAPKSEPWPTQMPETEVPMTRAPSVHSSGSGGAPPLGMDPRSHSASGLPTASSAAPGDDSPRPTAVPTAGPLPHTSLSNGAGTPMSSSTHGNTPLCPDKEDTSDAQKHVVFVCVALALCAVAAVVAAVVLLCCLRRRCPPKSPIEPTVVPSTPAKKTKATKKKVTTTSATTTETADRSSEDSTSDGDDMGIAKPSDFESIVDGRPVMPSSPEITRPSYPPLQPHRLTPHHADFSDIQPSSAVLMSGVVSQLESELSLPHVPEQSSVTNDVERASIAGMVRPETAPQCPATRPTGGNGRRQQCEGTHPKNPLVEGAQ